MAEDSLNQGEYSAAVADPVVEAVGALEKELAAIGVGFRVGEVAEAFDFVASAVEVGADLFADEATDEAFEFNGRFVVGASFAVAIAIGFADGAEAFEGAEALAGGAFADFQALDEVVERERGLGNEEEPVYFTDRGGQAKDADAIHEDREDFAFDRVDLLPGAVIKLLHV